MLTSPRMHDDALQEIATYLEPTDKINLGLTCRRLSALFEPDLGLGLIKAVIDDDPTMVANILRARPDL